MDLDPVQAVRLLTADVDTADPLLTDAQVNQYLALSDGRVYAAAADVLDAIATSEVLVSKKIRTQDLTTDGPAVAAELRAQAKRLRERQNDEDDAEWGGFSLIDTTRGTRRPELTEPTVWGL